MQIFEHLEEYIGHLKGYLEYPYVKIAVFAVGFLILVSVGILFALKGFKAAEAQPDNDFTTVSKLEANYKRLGKSRSDRCVMFVHVFADDPRDIDEGTALFAAIRRILLQAFSISRTSQIAQYEEGCFFVCARWNAVTTEITMKNLQEELRKCFLKHGVLNVVDTKIGVHFAIGTEVTFDEAINRAQQACALAREEQNFYVYWNASSGKELEQKIKIENKIEKEIDENRFFLVYQPVLDAKTKTIIGAEVLARLNSEDHGVVTPRVFLPAVNSVGINKKFDYYIFEKNCKWISNDKSQREGYQYTINFSRSTLSEPAFAEKIIGIAQKYDLKLSCLAVEVLEDKNVTGEAKQQMIDNIAVLKEKGVSILLDDFGSGFTTFSDLQHLDLSIIKIDREITQNATTDTGYIILKNIIETSKAIGCKTLCEGVETKEQEEAVIRAGCDLLQGYYYYHPMSVVDLENLFNDHSETI